MISSIVPFAAAGFSIVLAVAGLSSKRRLLPRWCFFAGMLLLAVDSVFNGLALRATELTEMLRWLTLGLVAKAAVPSAWLGFSVTFSRVDYREALSRWKIPMAVLAVLPIVVLLAFQQDLFEILPVDLDGAVQLRLSPLAKVVTIVVLVALVGILMNVEQTFRSAVGTTRWRIKFVVFGLTLIFGARLYVRSQTLLYPAFDPRWSGIESSALLVGCVFLVLGYARSGRAEISVFPSRAALRSSLTVLLVGGYLFTVGVMARLVGQFGGAEYFQLVPFIVLVGIAGAVVLLFSDRLRQRIHQFVSRHFARAQHDSVRIWTEFSRRLANVKDQAALCAAAAKLISETFAALSVNIWVADEQNGEWKLASSTSAVSADAASISVGAALRTRSSPFDLDRIDESWAEELRRLNPTKFPNGGHRWCVPLRAVEQNLGALVLADRISGARYTVEELHLLQCVAEQVASVLLNMRLAGEVARSREMEAFRTMSAFFVHDLKNTAASLKLMLRNAQTHFDDPEFRADALRGIGNAARRIDETIGRLSELRNRSDPKRVEADLNEVISEVLGSFDGTPSVELTKELQPLPRMFADREQIRSVVANLILNAREALGTGGRIRVRTDHLGDSLVLSVADNGCGIAPAFLKDSIFRPFQSTKKNGLGIGLFQSRMIVEAHGGTIRVESEKGKGSTFHVTLPAANGK